MVFKKLLTDGIFYPTDKDVESWKERSRSRWLARLSDGNNSVIGLEIIERAKEGWGGKYFYRFSPMYSARLNKLWKKLKKL